MAVDGINSTNNSAYTTQSLSGQNILGKDDFLRIFITQLQNQDPLKPLEDKEFIAQMAQFSSLEQISNLNSTAQKLLETQNFIAQDIMNIKGLLSNQNLGSYSELIGMKAYWFNQDGIEKTGEITGLILRNKQYFAVADGYEVLVTDLHKVELRTGSNGSNI